MVIGPGKDWGTGESGDIINFVDSIRGLILPKAVEKAPGVLLLRISDF